MEHSSVAVACLAAVEARDSAAVSYNHRHVHLEAIHFMSFVLGHLKAFQSVVHSEHAIGRVIKPGI